MSTNTLLTEKSTLHKEQERQQYLTQFFLQLLDRLSDRVGLSVPQMIDLEKLRQLPSDTLGHALAEHFDQQVFQPFTTGPRRKQLHDVVHVVTGYDTSLIGELEVQVFLLGAHFRPTHVLISLGLLRLIRHSQTQIPDLWTRVQRAYDRGKQAQLNLETWQPEHQWHLPLSQVQRQLRIVAEPAPVEFL